MAFTVFLGNLPVWVTADDITAWLTAENLVADSIKVIRNPETQESKGFAFIEAPNQEEMDSIIRRFDRAPLEDRLLRANPAQPPKRAGGPAMAGAPPMGARPDRPMGGPRREGAEGAQAGGQGMRRPPRTGTGGGARPAGQGGGKRRNDGPPSAFAEELAKAL
jgi:RNA recognition motif-containing protein